MTVTQEVTKIDSLIRMVNYMARMNKSRPNARKSQTMYFDMLVEYYSRIRDAKKNGEFLASHTVFFPTEILYAMDIVPMHTEMTTWLIALFLKEQANLLSKSAELGLSPEICSPHRGVAGILASKYIPRPDAVLWSNLICDNTAKSGELMMELNGSPGYFVDNPFQCSQGELDYLVSELKGMIEFLERLSGKKMNWNKLSELIENTNTEIALYREISELRKATPSPASILSYLELLAADYMFPGQAQAEQYLTRFRDELKEMIKNGIGAVPQERFRLMTLFIPPVFLIAYLGSLYEELGVVSVTEPMFFQWPEFKLDPSKPLESVAKKSFMIPERRSMYGPLSDVSLQDITDCAQQYKIDGAVYWAFMGCRHTCATIKIVKEKLNEIDIPMLTIDCDLVDPTITSEEEVRGKVEQFCELLEDR
ncbi:MAG: 2-hydroxyacyl-CoA dehydratase [Dehalococcoidales bacterium]|nr:2-hydroxyacyl-CoA dehydratase [Dehalococcoidales bacterium]